MDRVLLALKATGLPRPALSAVVRRELASLRLLKSAVSYKKLLSDTLNSLADLKRAQSGTAVNGTGIIIRADSKAGAAESQANRALLKASKADLRKRADAIKLAVEAMPMKTTIGEGKSEISGGALPRFIRTSVTLDLLPLNMTLTEFAARLRIGKPSVIGYLAGGQFRLDLRTIAPQQDEKLFRAIYKAFGV